MLWQLELLELVWLRGQHSKHRSHRRYDELSLQLHCCFFLRQVQLSFRERLHVGVLRNERRVHLDGKQRDLDDSQHGLHRHGIHLKLSLDDSQHEQLLGSHGDHLDVQLGRHEQLRLQQWLQRHDASVGDGPELR